MTYLFDRLAEQAKIDAKEEAGRQRDNAKYAKRNGTNLKCDGIHLKGRICRKVQGGGLKS